MSAENIRDAQPLIQDLLVTQLPFFAKVVVHYRLSEDSVGDDGVVNTIYSQRRTATVPLLVRPLANPDERLRRYIITAVHRRIEDQLEHARFHNSLQKFEGILDIQLFTTPSRELAQLPAAPGQQFAGGCWKDLPALLKSGVKGLWSPRNRDNKCFRYAVMAHLLGCATWGREARKQYSSCLGRPFYDLSAGRPRKAQRAQPPVDVFVGAARIDFDMLGDSPATFEDIDKFEEANAGLVEIYVYEWKSIPWLNEEFQYLLPVRSLSLEEEAQETILLLYHQEHYVLIYDLNRLSSTRSPNFLDSQRAAGHTSWNRCRRCMANFGRLEALAKHLAQRVCHLEPGKREVPALNMPSRERGANRLYYKAGCSAAMHPCVVYADFEVFNRKAPGETADQRILSTQHRVASFGYMCVGRSGFRVPAEHQLRLKCAGEDSGEFGIMEFFLRCLLALAKRYKDWRRSTNLPCHMSSAETQRFQEAEVCEICGAAFNATNRLKCVHHEHGTGRFVAAACSACNLGIKMPTSIPIYFHNGSSYDFHYVLRFLAYQKGFEDHSDYLQQLIREEEEESDEGEACSESEEEGDAAASSNYGRPPKPEDVDPWHCDLSKIPLNALVKGGEKCLMVSYGPLRFVDSMNIFPVGLSELIADCKASSLSRDPADAFPLLAERHPVFAAARQQGEEYWNKAWKLLLKKIPMPFDVFSGPSCWQWPAFLEDRSCYDSSLTGESCSEEQHKEVKEICEFFNFSSFEEFHNAYLCTDLALGDVLEHYRDAFWQHFQLDPCQYVTHASASHDAMLRLTCPRIERSLGLITDRRIYELTRRNIRGGPGHVAQPFAKANNPMIPGFDPRLETSWILFNDIVSMCPSIMAKPLPIDGGEWVDLPKNKKDRLKRLNALFDVVDYERDDEEVCYMVEVSYDVPWFRHSAVDWAPVCKMPVKRSQLSPYTRSLVQADQMVSETPKLVPYLGLHEKEAVDLRYLKFIMENLGVRVFEFHSLVMFKCKAFMKDFILDTTRTRRELKKAGRKLQAEVQKLTANVQYGKMVQNQESFRSTIVYTDGRKSQKKAAGPDMLDVHPQVMEEHAFMAFVDVKKAGKANVLKSFLQGGWKVLEESRLLMLKAHYKMRRVFDGHLMMSTDAVEGSESLRPEQSRVRWLGGDTDSSVLQIFSEQDPKIALADANLVGGGPFFDVAGDAKDDDLVVHLAPLRDASREAILQHTGELGNFADELAPHYGVEWVGLAPKMYSLEKTGKENKERAKGVPKAERKKLNHELYRQILEGGGEHRVSFCRLGCHRHVNEIVRVEKRGLTAVNTKTWQLNWRQARQLGHYKNNDVCAACWVALQKGKKSFDCNCSFVVLLKQPQAPGSMRLAGDR